VPEKDNNQQSYQPPTQPVYPYQPTAQLDYQQPYQPTAQPDYQQSYQPPTQPVYPYQPAAQSDYQQPYQQAAQPAYQQQPYQPYPAQQPYPPLKKGKTTKGLWWKVAIPAVFLISLITVGVIYLVTLISPLSSVTASIINLGKELDQRTNDTPMEMFGILFDSLESGSVTVDFHYKDMWDDTRGRITLHTDDSNNDVAVEVDITIDGFTVDLELYANRERTAARIRQIDNNFYGIRYDTFRNDFRSFANLLGLDQHDIDMVAELVDFYSDLFDVTGNQQAAYSQYDDLLRSLITNANISDENVDIISDGRSVRVKKVELTISERMIIKFLNDLIDLLENDDSIRALFEASNDLQAGMLGIGSSFNEMLRELRSEIRDLERELQGNLKIAFFIGNRDRLMRMEVDFDFSYAGEHAWFDILLDFGSSAHDDWVLTINTRDGRDSMVVSVAWIVRETSRGGETTLEMSSEDRFGSESFAITLDWNDRGSFNLSFRDSYSSENLLSGTYTKINNGFDLVIDDPFSNSWWEESLQLKISAVSRSGHIQRIDYINIADWDMSLLEKIEEFIYAGGGIAAPPPPMPGHTSISEADLYGSWTFSHGSITYFFWSADHVEFFDWGEVYSSDSAERNGNWTLDGNLLTVNIIGSYTTYHFTVEMDGGFLVITDSDYDTGYFERIR
jgi:hypothetical protein